MNWSQRITLSVSALLLSFATFSTPTAQEPARVRIDSSDVRAVYANFSRVTGTAEEVIIDMGLNTQATGVPAEPIRIDSRLVMNFYTAKRLLGGLNVTVQRHEKAFGPIEIDVRKRVLKAAIAPAPQKNAGDRLPSDA